MHSNFDDISLVPFKKDILRYNFNKFKSDLGSGVTVALLTVPQAMAYAILAGLPLSCGLLGAIYSAIVAAFFCSSRHLVVGPSNAIAILVQTGTAQILYTYFRDLSGLDRELMALQILSFITLLVGLIQILTGLFKLGSLVQFVSHSVVIGYIVGVAVAMVINQSYVLFGIWRLPGIHSLYDNGIYLISHLHQLQIPTALVGCGSLLLLVGLKRINKKIPAALITFALAGSITFFIDSYFYSSIPSIELTTDQMINSTSGIMLVKDVGDVHDVVPSLGLPFFSLKILNAIFPIAFAIALLSILETTSVAKSIAAASGQRLSVNQDIFGTGLGNLLSSFTGAMPVSGSPSRTSLNYRRGAQTRFAAIFNALFVTITLLLFHFLVSRIPLAALAALLLFSVPTMINKKQLLICLKATRSDAFVLWVTMLSCIFFNLDIALYIGVALSITLYLKKASIPQLNEYLIDDSGELKNIDLIESHEQRTIRVIKVEGELFFGSADLFQATMKKIAEDDTNTRVIILQMKNARDMDATTCLAVHQLYAYLKASGRYLIACGLTPPTWEVFSASGLVEEIGKDNLFFFDERHPHQYMQKAYHWAHELIKNHPAPNYINQVTEKPSEAKQEPILAK